MLNSGKKTSDPSSPDAARRSGAQMKSIALDTRPPRTRLREHWQRQKKRVTYSTKPCVFREDKAPGLRARGGGRSCPQSAHTPLPLSTTLAVLASPTRDVLLASHVFPLAAHRHGSLLAPLPFPVDQLTTDEENSSVALRFPLLSTTRSSSGRGMPHHHPSNERPHIRPKRNLEGIVE